MSASCIYEGTIRHRRLSQPETIRHRRLSQPETIRHRRLYPPGTARREFSHRIALAYVDLEELPRLLGGRLVSTRPGLLRFRRGDYLGDRDVQLQDAVRDTVQAQSGVRPQGSIRLLTNLRSFGTCFNPVSFYYCIERGSERLQAVVAEVTNTPWGDRHSYVISRGQRRSSVLAGAFEKALHVSPFMGMDHRYEARVSTPGTTLSVHITSARAGSDVFDATLALERRPLTRASAARMLARYPMACLRTLALIYAHALAMKLSGFPVHRRPRTMQQ